MPIYEYRCGECGEELDALQKVSEPPLTECPACGKPALQKQLSAAGFHLKGSGWYATDFKGSGKKPVEKKADAKTEVKAETKSDTKSADTRSAETKTESKPASTSTTTD
ncbi:MAG TPA: zinc ribbon domain-containing protein [Burkholderiales bacterium]|nr:zinc ribbon domain-containing protein [Burkholderiales bacterium]